MLSGAVGISMLSGSLSLIVLAWGPGMRDIGGSHFALSEGCIVCSLAAISSSVGT